MRWTVIGIVPAFCFGWRVLEESAIEEERCGLVGSFWVLGLEVEALGAFVFLGFKTEVSDFLGLPRRRGCADEEGIIGGGCSSMCLVVEGASSAVSFSGSSCTEASALGVFRGFLPSASC